MDLKYWLDKAVAESKAPGAAACVGRAGERLLMAASGRRQKLPATEAATTDTLYDLASLTKVLATTPAVMLLRDEGKLSLDQPVSDFLPLPGLKAFTLRHCITHTAGLVPYKQWQTEISSPAQMVQRIADFPLERAPGQRREYSDFGFILLGQVVEHVAGESLDAFCMRRIYKPLGLKRTMYRPDAILKPSCAATEQCPWRKRMLKGEVHDENASAMGGVSGHAGLFSTVEDLAVYCEALLNGKVLSDKTLDEMLTLGQIPFYPWQGLGWWIDPWTSGANGYLPVRAAFGHTGWTGTALWMDRATKTYAVLLSNTCHPSRNGRDNTSLRRTFFDGLALELYPHGTNAHTALDYSLRDDFSPLRGKGLAVLTNHAAIDELGRPLEAVFALDKGLSVRTWFSPEHGLRGQAEAGKDVRSEQGAVPVVSLYGEQNKPTAEQLRRADLFVIDLPDVGSRYYTYAATMKDCLAACAAAKTPVLVLDRPNPLGGVVLEGPLATSSESPVCWAQVPVRHGMTLGEIARYFQDTLFTKSKLDLTVQPAENWRRELMFPECSLTWSPPSPNLPTAESALVYVGACLFEGVNMNEGRGTQTPFLLLGAPWLDAKRLLDALDTRDHAGFSLETKGYIPKAIPGKASDPVHKGKLCKGVRLTVTDWAAARPFRTAVALLCAIHRQHGAALEWKPNFDTLAGGDWLRTQIQQGRPAGDIVAEAEAGHGAFDQIRPKLYSTSDQIREGYARG